jgi:hypothetical protein
VHLHNVDPTKQEKEVNHNCSKKFLDGAAASIIRKAMTAPAGVVFLAQPTAKDRAKTKRSASGSAQSRAQRHSLGGTR